RRRLLASTRPKNRAKPLSQPAPRGRPARVTRPSPSRARARPARAAPAPRPTPIPPSRRSRRSRPPAPAPQGPHWRRQAVSRAHPQAPQPERRSAQGRLGYLLERPIDLPIDNRDAGLATSAKQQRALQPRDPRRQRHGGVGAQRLLLERDRVGADHQQ